VHLGYADSGHGHRDHVRVHEVGARAAALCGVRVWEATLPRELVVPFLTLLRMLRVVGRYDAADIRTPGPLNDRPPRVADPAAAPAGSVIM